MHPRIPRMCVGGNIHIAPLQIYYVNPSHLWLCILSTLLKHLKEN